MDQRVRTNSAAAKPVNVGKSKSEITKSIPPYSSAERIEPTRHRLGHPPDEGCGEGISSLVTLYRPQPGLSAFEWCNTRVVSLQAQSGNTLSGVAKNLRVLRLQALLGVAVSGGRSFAPPVAGIRITSGCGRQKAESGSVFFTGSKAKPLKKTTVGLNRYYLPPQTGFRAGAKWGNSCAPPTGLKIVGEFREQRLGRFHQIMPAPLKLK